MKKTKRILLIDDEDAVLFGFTRVLKEPGIEIDCAQTIEEAQSLIDANHYDAAIIDLRLSPTPQLEGFECVRRLRLTQRNCRIIVLTAYGDNATWEKSENLGVDLFLEKPIEPAIIRKTLKTFGVYEN